VGGFCQIRKSFSEFPYVIQDAIETLAQADCEHGCDSSTSSILQYYGLVERYQKARRKEEHLSR
ncbi:hypothetical protein ACV357_27770, partial [Pseudomonas aeruginosa]